LLLEDTFQNSKLLPFDSPKARHQQQLIEKSANVKFGQKGSFKNELDQTEFQQDFRIRRERFEVECDVLKRLENQKREHQRKRNYEKEEQFRAKKYFIDFKK
jgi:hypothetical protein